MDTTGRESPVSVGHIRTRRSAPLGIIGSISKSLFGLITTDDADLINKNIDQLFKDQRELIRLNGEKTHILSAAVEDLYNVTASHRKALKALEKDLQNRINTLAQNEDKTSLLWHLSAIANQVNAKMDHLIYCNKELLRILNNLANRIVDPALIRDDTLQQIAADIKQLDGEFDFPIPLQHLRKEEVARLATTDATYHNGRVIVSISLPLTDRTLYELYQIHPIDIHQGLDPSTIGSASLAPQQPYLAIGRDQKYYFMLSAEDLHRCRSTHYAFVCSSHGILRTVGTHNECEVEMLLNPRREALSSCQIVVKPSSRTQWTYLAQEGTWIFSVRNTDTMRIDCPGEDTQTCNIKGIGILRLAAGCIARTPTTNLIANRIQEASEQRVYNPDLTLNVSEIYEAFQTRKDMELNITSLLKDPSLHLFKAESLKTLIGRMEEIGQHRRDKGFTNNLIYGGLSGQILLIVCLTAVWWFQRYHSRRPTNPVTTLIKFHKAEVQDHPTEIVLHEYPHHN